jgi:H/ACA ribonucleoprotein complex subunit 2
MSESESSDKKTQEQSKLFVSPIAEPLASDKLSKKLIKLIKKSMKDKSVKRGVKETVKAVAKDNKGICVIAADISPIDVLSHLAILCEEKNVPYIYVKSRAEIGEACKTKRPTSCVFITTPAKKSDNEKKFAKAAELIRQRNPYLA